MKISNKKVKVKLDIGAEINVMLMRVFKQIKDGHVKMERTKTKLCGYGGTRSSEFYVVKTDSKTLLSLQKSRELETIYTNTQPSNIKRR